MDTIEVAEHPVSHAARPRALGISVTQGRVDLMLETLVTDPDMPYHGLFSPAIVQIAQERLDKYRAGRD